MVVASLARRPCRAGPGPGDGSSGPRHRAEPVKVYGMRTDGRRAVGIGLPWWSNAVEVARARPLRAHQPRARGCAPVGLQPDVMRRLIFALARRCWHRQPQLQVYNCCPNQCSPACGQGNVYGPSTAPNANSHTRSDRARPIRGDGRGQPCTTSVPCRAGPRRRLIGTSTPAPSRRRCRACEQMVAGQSRSGLPWWSNAVEVARQPL